VGREALRCWCRARAAAGRGRRQAAGRARRYEKYDAPLGGKKGKADDPFLEEHEELEMQIQQLMQVRRAAAARGPCLS
jgi:hypothetical protein